MRPVQVPAGATIFRAGDPSEAVYLIEDGEVAITVGDGLEVVRLFPGELFGESGVLEARPRAATATAITATGLLVTEAATFLHAFGMENDRALALVKLLCRRLRSTSLRSVHSVLPDEPGVGDAVVRLVPDSERLVKEFGMTAIEVRHLPFQVANRFGGETLQIASNHSCCISAHGNPELAAPHFEILRRDGRVGVRDLGSAAGTVINGLVTNRASFDAFVPLRKGDNVVIAGRMESPFRFRVFLPG